jgi:hypothetical protein
MAALCLLIVGGLLALLAHAAHAAEPPASVMLEAGQPAPWRGALVDVSRLRLAAMERVELTLCRVELEAEREERAADGALAGEELAACSEQVASLLDAGREAVELPPVPVWSRPWVVGGLVAGGAVAVTAAAAAASTEDRTWIYVAIGGLAADAVVVAVAAVID